MTELALIPKILSVSPQSASLLVGGYICVLVIKQVISFCKYIINLKASRNSVPEELATLTEIATNIELVKNILDKTNSQLAAITANTENIKVDHDILVKLDDRTKKN